MTDLHDNRVIFTRYRTFSPPGCSLITIEITSAACKKEQLKPDRHTTGMRIYSGPRDQLHYLPVGIRLALIVSQTLS